MKVINITIVLLVLLLQGCLMGSADMDRMIRVMEKDSPTEFEDVMNAFIEHASNGNLDGMMNLTSDITIKRVGRANLENLYQTDLILFFSTMCAKIHEGAEVFHVTEKQTRTGSGWMYFKTCERNDGKKVSMRVVVLRENGRIAITSFGPDERK